MHTFTSLDEFNAYALEHHLDKVRIADMPKKMINAVSIPEPVIDGEVPESDKPGAAYIPFICTKCGKPTDRVLTKYRRGGAELIPDGHELCPGCFSRKNMVSLKSIIERRPVKVEPLYIRPTNLVLINTRTR
ncbi:MAG: hypothetical protein ACOYMF_06055 [Bacteroidales bacterium]